MADGEKPAARARGEGDRAARRLRRPERREQLLAAAARAFARSGFAGTSLDDIAQEAGISRVILYRHFDSKADMYRAVLDRVCTHLAEACGVEGFTDATIDALVDVAAADPDGFRLLFRHAAREPEFREEMARFHDMMADVALRELRGQITDPAWARWAARVAPEVAVDAIVAWLDAGRPGPGPAERIQVVLGSVTEAAQGPAGR